MNRRIITVFMWMGYGASILAASETQSLLLMPLIMALGFWAAMRTLEAA